LVAKFNPRDRTKKVENIQLFIIRPATSPDQSEQNISTDVTPVRSAAYFPEWKLAFRPVSDGVLIMCRTSLVPGLPSAGELQAVVNLRAVSFGKYPNTQLYPGQPANLVDFPLK
jgi:hypothetical protein